MISMLGVAMMCVVLPGDEAGRRTSFQIEMPRDLAAQMSAVLKQAKPKYQLSVKDQMAEVEPDWTLVVIEGDKLAVGGIAQFVELLTGSKHTVDEFNWDVKSKLEASVREDGGYPASEGDARELGVGEREWRDVLRVELPRDQAVHVIALVKRTAPRYALSVEDWPAEAKPNWRLLVIEGDRLAVGIVGKFIGLLDGSSGTMDMLDRKRQSLKESLESDLLNQIQRD